METISTTNQDQNSGETPDNSGVAAESPHSALATSVLINNYPLKEIVAEYFTGPVSSEEYGWRTMPMLLRRVADWMDSVDLQDPEFHGLEAGTVWPGETGGEEFYESTTVYYRNK